MAMTLPILVFGIGAIFFALGVFIDEKRRRNSFEELATLVLSVVAIIALCFPGYGIYGWLRYDAWQSVTVADAYSALSRNGIDTSPFLARVNWQGVQHLNDSYLESNVGWTFFFIWIAWCIAFVRLYAAVEERQRKARELEAMAKQLATHEQLRQPRNDETKQC